MAYKAGDLRLYTEPCPLETEGEFAGECARPDGHECAPLDSRGEYERKVPVAALPHSCDEWVIGGKHEVRAMIEDLKRALASLETLDRMAHYAEAHKDPKP
jgi:hypothetical protein